ncbi:MAG TPA: carboxypeptidase-like regulatory domain-containing protein [Chitinophagaceae bacterium]|jgi:hypothetical protein|nr:carboxypeptidase-like regulatory domain-containing protein [Chitinophagaceae bacterium]
MAKQLQLTIPEPCHEGWENMTPSEKGRFCDSCQKQVIDFSVMSDREVAEFFKRSLRSSKGESVCGHFKAGQLDHAIDIPKKRIPWIKYFFQFTIPAFLLSIKVSAQRSPGKTTTNTARNTTLPEKGSPAHSGTGFISLAEDTAIIPAVSSSLRSNDMIDGMVASAYLRPQQVYTGKIVNESGEPLVGATIMIKGTKIGMAAGPGGEFSLKTKKIVSELVLQASYIGYETLELRVDANSPASLTMVLKERDDRFVQGFIICVRPPVKKEVKNVPLMHSVSNDTKAAFTVFPNPVAQGSKLNIAWKKIKEGDYSLSLSDQSGGSVYQQNVKINAEIKELGIQLPTVAAGSYFLVLVNQKTGKKLTEKIIIQ